MSGMDPRDISRRDFIALGGATLAGATLLSACGPLGESPGGKAKDRVTRSFNPIPRENKRSGSIDWRQTGEHDGGIHGFVDKISARQGEQVKAFVSTDAGSFRAEIYRVGWYGGKGARLMHVEERVAGVRQDDPVLTKPLDNMIEARWKPSFTFRPNRKWVTGTYLIKLRSERGSENYIPFIVRDDRPSAIFYQLPVTTWLAYNVWGGRGIYKCIEGRGAGDWDARSRLVSMDRPFSQDDKDTRSGADRFFNFDLSMVRFLERVGFDVTYGTNIETHAKPKLLLQHDMFLTAGHDEYWTTEMRDNLEAVRAAGVNMAFLGANMGYRAVRLEDSPLGEYRRMRHYKEYTEDPLLDKDNDRVASMWRDGILGRPENALMGIMYVANPVDDPWVCTEHRHWLYEGTGLKKGYEVPHMVGHEFDAVFTDGVYADYTPENIEILATSPVGVRDLDDKVVERSEAHTTLFVDEDSGAGVFAAGTNRWNWFLDGYGGHYYELSVKGGDAKIQRLTAKLFDSMSRGPLARHL